MVKNQMIVPVLGVLAALSLASPALAQSSSSSSAGGDAESRVAPGATSAASNGSTQSSTTLDKNKLDERAAKVSAEQRTKADAKFAAQAKKVDASASSAGDAKMAARLSKEFNVSADALAQEQQKFDAGWGQILIAHTLQASTTGDVTADQLLGLRQSGMGWGQIAAGLGLSLGKAMSAVSAESQVALGQARADGQVARIQGAGVQAGMNTAAEAHLPAADASVTSGVGLGLGHR